ncbi:hypothetical protein BDE02_10G071200 [Populus trichocarpa]|jgi:hypothetical protein|nr:hypothetical protein BDE02_10G071200 [Populus trichocarpa]
MVPSYALLALVHPPLLAHGFDALLLTVREIVPHSPRAQPKKVFNAPTIYMETLTNLSAKLHGSLLGVTIFNLHHQGPLLTFSIYKFCFYLFLYIYFFPVARFLNLHSPPIFHQQQKIKIKLMIK